MYRCVSWAVIKDEIDLSNDRQLLNFLKKFKIDLKNTGNRSSFYVNNKDVTDLIRKSNISQKVSEVSAIPDIRDFMVDIQRNLRKK